MTRKHFQTAADMISDSFYTQDERRMIALFCVALFKQFNSRFNRDRFMVACGVGDE